MFPYKDENPTFRTPIITVALIGLNVMAWVLVQGGGGEPALSQSVCDLGLVPGHLLGALQAGARIRLGPDAYCELGNFPAWGTVLTSMFMHGGWLHLIGNMWFLWIFGNNIEDATGRFRFVVFYLLCGVAAALTQSLITPKSGVPMVGASGAISGVMGAYVVLYPRVRVHMLVFLGFFITRIAVPAYLMLGYWFLLQLVGGGLANEMGGTAFFAHVGGFLAGMLLIYPFRNRRLTDGRTAIADGY
jgi:membrane associated rhomboid family serine protease